MTILYHNDEYLTGREAARYFNVSHVTFLDKYAPHLRTYPIPGYSRQYYKKADLENYQGPRIKRDEGQ